MFPTLASLALVTLAALALPAAVADTPESGLLVEASASVAGGSEAGAEVNATKSKDFNNGTIKVSAMVADVDASGDCTATAGDVRDLECVGKVKDVSNGTIKVSA